MSSFASSPRLDDERTISDSLDVVEGLVRGEPLRTESLAREYDRRADGLGLPALAAGARYVLGRLAAERGDRHQTLGRIEAAVSACPGAGPELRALGADLGRMPVLDDLGRHHEAIRVGRALIAELAITAASPDTDADALRSWIQAAALENIGVAHGFLGDHQAALDAFTEAEATYRAMSLEAETARLRARSGAALLELGRGREAMELLASASTTFALAGDRVWAAKCEGFIALAHVELAEYVDALRLLGPARESLEALGAHAEAIRIQLATANVYLVVGLSDEAHREASAAAGQASKTGLARDVAAARLIGARAQLAGRNLDDARRLATQASHAFEVIGDRQQLARARLLRAEIAAAAGDRTEALMLSTEAADELSAGGWLVLLAWAHLRSFDHAPIGTAASDHLARAAHICSKLDVPQLRHACDLRRARVLRRAGAQEDAEAHLRRAIAEIEHIGERLPELTLRLAFRDDAVAAYEELIDLLVDRGTAADVAEALRIATGCKSRTLTDWEDGRIGRHLWRCPSSPGAAADDRTRVALDTAYGTLLAADPVSVRAADERAAVLENQIVARRITRTSRSTGVAPGGGRAAQGRRTADGPPLARVIELQVSGSDLIGFVSQDGVTTARRLSGAMPAIELELDRLTAQWSRMQIGPELAARHQALLVDTCRRTLGRIHDLVMAPFLGQLVSERGAELVVIPHRRLNEVPFHALFDGAEYLVERWAVTVAPSGDFVAPRADIVGRTALVLAVPDGHTPDVVTEAASLAELLPDVVSFLGSAATFEALAGSLPGPGLVHFACHGLFRPANPLFSSLRLADRWVQAVELLDLDLDGALVTLSACESGRGSNAAEPVGLGWAFLAAGASGVIVSQWVVNDTATAALMTDLYGHLSSGMAPASALRQAQLSAARRHPHPFYWAPFAYVGAPHTCDRRSASHPNH